MDPEEVAYVEGADKEPWNNNKGAIERKQLFFATIKAVELGYLSPSEISHPKTRKAVLDRIAKAGVAMSALMYGRGYYRAGSQQPSSPSFQAKEAVTF